jgi:hypothetical protein
MSRGNRGIILAIVGWLILATSPEQNAASSDRSQSEQASAQTLQNIATAIKVANERQQLDTGCGAGQEARDSDLCAQWKAADAAADSAWWAWASGVVGFLSLGGVLVALGLAFHSNRIASDAAQRQLRAYVTSGVKRCVIVRGRIKIRIVLRNHGVTPAIDVRTCTEYFDAPHPIGDTDFPIQDPSEENRSSSLIPPGGEITYEFDAGPVAKIDRDKLNVDNHRRYVAGVATYRDVFGRRWRTTYCRFVKPDFLNYGPARDKVPEERHHLRMTTASCWNSAT